jgi:hypothetical protein
MNLWTPIFLLLLFGAAVLAMYAYFFWLGPDSEPAEPGSGSDSRGLSDVSDLGVDPDPGFPESTGPKKIADSPLPEEVANGYVPLPSNLPHRAWLENGGVTCWEDLEDASQLQDIRHIGASRAEDIREYLTKNWPGSSHAASGPSAKLGADAKLDTEVEVELTR